MGKFTQGLLDTDLILKTLDIEAGQIMLDAGCGNGYVSKLLAERVGQSGKVYALDKNNYFIQTLKKETQGSNIEPIEVDITSRIPLNDSSIDIIYVSTVMHIFSSKQIQDFLQEAKRLLKPNGTLAIVEIAKEETPFGPPLESRYSPQELKEIVPMLPGDTVQVGEHFYMQLFQN
jgi:ubiquinone/menaquinone biosynthesis C-methylase UbiE